MSDPVDLHDPATRRQLSDRLPAALQILRVWGLDVRQQAELLGLSLRAVRRVGRGELPPPLHIDQLTRLTLILDLHRLLHALYPPEVADRWLLHPSGLPPFGQERPLDYLRATAIPGLLAVQQYLVACDSGGEVPPRK
jgi:Protein of unknown function (DUF2384)